MVYIIPPRASELVLNIEEFPDFWSLSGLYYTDNEEEQPVESFPPHQFDTEEEARAWVEKIATDEAYGLKGQVRVVALVEGDDWESWPTLAELVDTVSVTL